MANREGNRRRGSLQHYVSIRHQSRPQWTNFAAGGAAAISGWFFVHPFDVVKVRAQINTPSPPSATAARCSSAAFSKAPSEVVKARKLGMISVMKEMIRVEGFSSLYSGLSAALVRQLTYGNLRLGFYATFRQMYIKRSNKEKPSAVQNLSIGLAAGGCAAFLSNPVEVALVRMQADGKLPIEEKRNYKNIFDALSRIIRQEGVLSLWKGASPTVVRAMVVNALQVGGYEAAKTTYKDRFGMRESVGLHLSSSLTAGFIYSFATLPLDTAKTRMQTQKGREYRSIVQTVTKIAKAEGVMSLWNGFFPYFARCGGHTVAMFLFLEQYKKVVEHYYPSRIYR